MLKINSLNTVLLKKRIKVNDFKLIRKQIEQFSILCIFTDSSTNSHYSNYRIFILFTNICKWLLSRGNLHIRLLLRFYKWLSSQLECSQLQTSLYNSFKSFERLRNRFQHVHINYTKLFRTTCCTLAQKSYVIVCAVSSNLTLHSKYRLSQKYWVSNVENSTCC